MLDVNLALISRLGKVATPNAGSPATATQAVAWVRELANLGYAASEELLQAMVENSKAGDGILEALRAHARAHVDYKPLHGNFAEFMKDASDLEVYVSAIFHYMSVYFDMPELDSKTDSGRRELRNATELAVLHGASKSEAAELAKTIVTQGQPFSETDFEHVKALASLVPANSVDVSIRENLAALAVLDAAWAEQMSTVTDVLRLAVALSGGHPSLAERERIRLRKSQRRLIASTLDRVLIANGENHEDFARFPEFWKRVAASAHLRDFGRPAVDRAMTAVYNESAVTFNSRVEAAKDETPVRAADVLIERPGDFARALMELVRVATADEREYVLEKFRTVAPRVSLRVLIQLFDYVRGPKKAELACTPLFTKNSAGGAIDNKRDGDYSDVLEAILEGFRDRLSGRVFNVDRDDAEQYAIPMGVRTASAANKIIGRGSRLKLSDDAKFARLFMHWTNGNVGRVDLDLSGVFISEDLSRTEAIWYGGLRSSDGKSYHSGDIVDAPDGAAEFIDVPLEVTDSGMRYVALTVYSYSGQKLADVPEAWAGVMERSSVNSGENFEPADVSLRGDLCSESTTAMPLIVDLKEREVIWVDREMHGQIRGGNVLNSRPDLLLHDAILQPRMTVAELLTLTGATVDEDGEELDPARAEQVLNLLV